MCIKNVSKALSCIAYETISYPWNLSDICSVKQGVAEYGNFPACLGAIVGTKIRIKAPPVDESVYVGRHTGHFINCQVVCDPNLKFLDAAVRWPGSVNDSTIWENCYFKSQLVGFFV